MVGGCWLAGFGFVGVFWSCRRLSYGSSTMIAIVIWMLICYFIKVNTGLELIDLLGIRLDTSQYISLIASMILLLLLYLGNILTLANLEISSRPEPGSMLRALQISILFSNSLPVLLISFGSNLYTSIFFSSFLSSFSIFIVDIKNVTVQVIILHFIVSSYESYLFLMTGSTFSLWFTSACNHLLSYPDYHLTPKRNYLIEFVHFISIIIFTYIFPLIINPYNYSGVFYKIHVKHNFLL